jgi:hypothetical protein
LDIRVVRDVSPSSFSTTISPDQEGLRHQLKNHELN